ncbi:hypothetical protein D3C80_1643040 [compost metagenome]
MRPVVPVYAVQATDMAQQIFIGLALRFATGAEAFADLAGMNIIDHEEGDVGFWHGGA